MAAGVGLHSDIQSGNLDPSFRESIQQRRAQKVQLGRDRAVGGENNNFSLPVIGDRARMRELLRQDRSEGPAQFEQPPGLRHKRCDAVGLGQERVGALNLHILGMHSAWP